MIFQFFSNSMIFPCMELFFGIFQVFQVFQCSWEPWSMVCKLQQVSDHCYGLGVKGKGHKYLKSVYSSQDQFLFHFLMERIHIQQNDCLLCVKYK